MTFTDILTHSSKLFHSFSVSDHLNKKDLRQTQNLEEKKNTNQQQQNSFLHLPSELSRSISNKSITFASIFDESENELINKDNHVTFDLETEDLVVVVPNKYVNNEPFTDPEPYPFRSELPLCSFPKSDSSRSGKKLLQHLIHHHRPKKLRHPIKTIDRSKSAPNMLCSLPSTTITNNNPRTTKTFRRWFKSLSISRYLPSFIKPSLKQKSHQKLITLRKSNDLIY